MISVIIPVYNEEEIIEDSLRRVHERLDSKNTEHEILVIDNGSDDRTAEICKSLSSEHGWVRYFEIEERSVGKAFACGVKNARSDYIITADADLSSDLAFILDARYLLDRASMVVGAKSLGRQKRTAFRKLASYSYVIIAQWMFDLSLSDFSIGAKAYRKSDIEDAVGHISDWTGYVLELSLYLRLREKRIIQIGIECLDKRKSHFNLLHEGFYRYWHLFKCWTSLRNGSAWFAKLG